MIKAAFHCLLFFIPGLSICACDASADRIAQSTPVWQKVYSLKQGVQEKATSSKISEQEAYLQIGAENSVSIAGGIDHPRARDICRF